jgi:uncharacterized protein YhfF
MKSEAVTKFWEEACRSNSAIDPASTYDAWHFCDTRECANKLYKLVLDGIKRATACLANDLGEVAPRAGNISIVTDFDGEPKCIIRLTDVRTVPFHAVDEQFASDEGEGDGTLTYWREAHTRFFNRRCDELGITFDSSMDVICQRFEVLYPA